MTAETDLGIYWDEDEVNEMLVRKMRKVADVNKSKILMRRKKSEKEN